MRKTFPHLQANASEEQLPCYNDFILLTFEQSVERDKARQAELMCYPHCVFCYEGFSSVIGDRSRDERLDTAEAV